MAVGIWSSFKLFENVLASTKSAIYFFTQCKDREMGIPARVTGNLPVAELFSWPVTLLLKVCLIRRHLITIEAVIIEVAGQVTRMLAAFCVSQSLHS